MATHSSILAWNILWIEEPTQHKHTHTDKHTHTHTIHIMFLLSDSINKIKILKELYLTDLKVSDYTLKIINIIENYPNELQIHINWEIVNINV